MHVLLALPASGSQGGGGVSIPIPGTLSVTGYTAGVTFTAPGLDYGFLSNSSSSSSQVTYQ